LRISRSECRQTRRLNGTTESSCSAPAPS